jgi:hypothetical protein
MNTNVTTTPVRDPAKESGNETIKVGSSAGCCCGYALRLVAPCPALAPNRRPDHRRPVLPAERVGLGVNKFYGRFVRIQEDRGHTVITGGPYRCVRHPGMLALRSF